MGRHEEKNKKKKKKKKEAKEKNTKQKKIKTPKLMRAFKKQRSNDNLARLGSSSFEDLPSLTGLHRKVSSENLPSLLEQQSLSSQLDDNNLPKLLPEQQVSKESFVNVTSTNSAKYNTHDNKWLNHYQHVQKLKNSDDTENDNVTTYHSNNDQLKYYQFKCLYQSPIVTNKPLILEIICQKVSNEETTTETLSQEQKQKDKEDHYRLFCKLSEKKITRRINYTQELDMLFIDNTENMNWIHSRLDTTHALDVIGLIPALKEEEYKSSTKDQSANANQHFLLYVETRGGKSKGRKRQQYILLDKNGSYIIASTLTVLQVNIRSSKDGNPILSTITPQLCQEHNQSYAKDMLDKLQRFNVSENGQESLIGPGRYVVAAKSDFIQSKNKQSYDIPLETKMKEIVVSNDSTSSLSSSLNSSIYSSSLPLSQGLPQGLQQATTR